MFDFSNPFPLSLSLSRWDSPELRARNIQESRIFAIVTRRQGSPSENVCHVFSELDPAQPATAVVRFVTKHLLGGQ